MSKDKELDSLLDLCQADGHVALRIRAIAGGWGVRRNLNQMGLHVGDVVSVVHRAPFGGPVLIESHGSRVAVGRQLAEKIKVEVIR
jgi:Fe2+ transport system protein FeoA